MADLHLTADLAAFLRTGGNSVFAWGSRDCCTWVCDWVLARRGIDPAAPFRGRYKTVRGAAGFIRRAGSLAIAVSQAMERAGLERTEAPDAGDIGLIATSDGDALAIRTARGWASRGLRGITISTSATCIVAWKV